jgi:hypothetical protein
MGKGGTMMHIQPPARLLRAIRGSSRESPQPLEERRIADAYREILREYRTIASGSRLPGHRWRSAALKALGYLGGDADRIRTSLRDYDHHRYGPFLGVSDDGDAAAEVYAALASPGSRLDAAHRRLPPAWHSTRNGSACRRGSVRPDEFSDIWSKCVAAV